MLNRRIRGLAVAAVCGLTVSTAAGGAQAASTGPRVDFHAWSQRPDFRSGTAAGIAELPGLRQGIVMTTPVGTVDYQDPYCRR